MSEDRLFRTFVNERLAAAAEDICALFERTIAEYEEKLCRCQEREKQRQQQQLCIDFLPKVLLRRVNVDIPEGLQQKIIETPQIKQEEEQSVSPLSESTGVCVTREEKTSAFKQTQTEPMEETKDINLTSEGQTHHSSGADNEEDWRSPLTDGDVDHSNQVQTTDDTTQPPVMEASTSVSNVDMSQTEEGAERKKHECPVCKKRFVGKKYFQKHCKSHTEKNPYSCSVCEKTFIQKCNLDRHMPTHTGEKPYSCTVCKKTFSHKHHLNVHKRTHPDNQPYSCFLCKKPFSKKSKLNMHIRTHTGKLRSYSCSTCQKVFICKESLDAHKKTHTVKKPYSCVHCKMAFTQRFHLNMHMRTHTGVKPYSCSHCEKTFRHKSNLTVHMRTHSGEKPFSCPVCKKTFSQKSNIRSHFINNH